MFFVLSSTFTGLSDTPANYTGNSGKYLKVDGNNIVFDTPAGSGDAILADNQTFSGNNVFTGDTSMADVSVNVLEIGGRLFPSGGSDGQVLKLSNGNLTWAADGGGGGGPSCCPRIVPPAEHAIMLTPLIVVNVTSV